jgi:hypothetical protein
MPEGRDTTSEQVSARLAEAQGVLAEAKRIFDEETTAEHRSQWPNVFRLESATEHTQKTLALADPQITQEDAANELLESATQARDAIRAAVDSGGGDLIGSANRLLSATSQVRLLSSDVDTAASAAIERFAEAERDVLKAHQAFETRGGTLTKFLDDLTNVAAEIEFQKQAEGYEKESRFFWTAGLITLISAAGVALLPLILNYVNHEHHGLEGQSNISAHFAVALAFAAVSGVFLARARNRDRNRQRNRDLSVALITMFAYSEQIANDQERERFKHDMGRLVLEAFLRQEPPSEDRSNSVFGDLTARAGSPGSSPQS